MADTYFAPALRKDFDDICRQRDVFAQTAVFKTIFDIIPTFIAVLNYERQIIFANKAFVEYFNKNNLSDYLGKRPGEAIACLHASDCQGGCGTSKACSVCGAVEAITLSQKMGSANSECRISLESGDALDLAVYTNQFKFGEEEFTIFIANDISSNNRRRALERIFLHDLLNTSGALVGFLDILSSAPSEEKEDYINLSIKVADNLVEEINTQKDLIFAEDSELCLDISGFSTGEIIEEVIAQFENHSITSAKILQSSADYDDEAIISDHVLLRRVLVNLVKNALEASHEKEAVTISCKIENDFAEFSVHNNSFIPEIVQYQIFQRSFSTKGKGRGLGTYSVKLLTERYLNGRAYFRSSPDTGTTFFVKVPLHLNKK